LKNTEIIHFDSPDKRGIDVASKKRNSIPVIAIFPIHLQKTSSTTEIENQYRRKTDDELVSTKKLYYARSIACNWFLEVRKLILSSIIGHHGLVAKKIKPFRSNRNLEQKKSILYNVSTQKV
jgi:hypothetical protein